MFSTVLTAATMSWVFIVSAFVVGIVVGHIVTLRMWQRKFYRKRVVKNWNKKMHQ